MKDSGKDDLFWCMLLHLGMNMWAKPFDRLLCEDDMWRQCTDRMQAGGLDMLIIDVGEGVVFPSHPELAVKGSWTPEKLNAEVRRLRAQGIEAIPKLNFSTTHDAWLGAYGRMVSTPGYYKVCGDVIGDLVDIFERPRFFHIGMEEENAKMGKSHDMVVIRQGELWWHDFNFLRKEVERRGVRAWCWADWADWRDREKDYFDHMPKSVMLSNCFYGLEADFDRPFKYPSERKRLESFVRTDERGYDQVPIGTNWTPEYYAKDENNDENIQRLARFSVKHLSKEHLKGLLMAPWTRTTREKEKKLLNSIDFMIAARKEYLASRAKCG